MANDFLNNNPIINNLRTGTENDSYYSYENIPDKVVGNKVQLNEIPDPIQKVRVVDPISPSTTYFETASAPSSPTQYMVDYRLGIIYFSSEAEGKSLQFTYYGRGVVLQPVARIWTQQENGNVVETLGDIVQAGRDGIENINTLNMLVSDTLNAKNQMITDTTNAVNNMNDKRESYKYDSNDYNTSKQYKVNNQVTYNGKTYICIQDTIGHSPVDTTYWRIFASGSDSLRKSKTWTTTTNMTDFDISDIGKYAIGTYKLEVVVNGALQINGVHFDEISNTLFRFKNPLSAGLTVFARWFDGDIGTAAGHNAQHRKGGGDELNLRDLIGYTDMATQDFGLRNITSQMYDNFDKTDAMLNGSKSLSGHTWNVSGPGQNIAKIQNGRLISDGSNFYASLDYGQTLKYIHASYSFTDTGLTTNVTDNVVIIMQGAPYDLGNMIHLICGLNSLTIDKKIGPNWIHIPLTIVYDVKLNTNTTYTTSMTLEGNKLTIIDAVGRSFEYVDNEFLTINPTWATYQIGPQPSSQFKGLIHSVSAGEKGYSKAKGDTATKMDLVPIRNDISWLYGSGSNPSIVRRQRQENITVSQNGWINVAKSLLYGGNIINGTVNLSAKDSTGRTTTLKLLINNKGIVALNIGQLVGGTISQIRLRSVSGVIYFDIYFPTATTNSVTFTADYEGFFTLVTPVIISDDTGVISSSVVGDVGPSISQRQSQEGITISQNGWINIAKSTTYGGGYITSGTILLSAKDTAGRTTAAQILVNNKSLAVSNGTQLVGNGAVTQVRLRVVSGVNYLDIYLPSAATNAVTLSVTYEGFFALVTPVPTDDIGANAANTVTITYPTIREVSFQATATDFYTVATQTAMSFGFTLTGRAQIEAYNSSGYVLFDVIFNQTTTLTIINTIKKNVSPITSMRTTSDSSNIHLDIQFANAATYPTTVSITFTTLGKNVPVVSPVSGATALTNVLSATV